MFDANNKTGGTLDYTNSIGPYLHGIVTARLGREDRQHGHLRRRDHRRQRRSCHGGTDYFTGVVIDVSTSGRNGDEIAVFVNEDPRRHPRGRHQRQPDRLLIHPHLSKPPAPKGRGLTPLSAVADAPYLPIGHGTISWVVTRRQADEAVDAWYAHP